jgi:hypothetical protein
MVIGQLKVLLDGAFFAYQLFSLLFLLLFAIPFIHTQRNFQMVPLFLSLPMSPANIIVGIIIGFTLLQLCACLFFYSIGLITLHYWSGHWFYNLMPGFIAINAESFLLLQFVIFISLLLSLPLTYIATIALYATCYLNYSLYQVATTSTGWFYVLARACYYLLPDLQLLDIRQAIIYDLPIAWSQVAAQLGYLLLFSLIIALGSIRVANAKRLQ